MLEQLLNAHDYAFYIWGSVGLTCVILIGNAWYAVHQLRQAQKQSSTL